MFRNKYTFAGLVGLCASLFGLAYIDLSAGSAVSVYWHVAETGCAILMTCSLAALAYTFGGLSTLIAYHMAMAWGQCSPRNFAYQLARRKHYCAAVGWQMAAEDLGYTGDRF